MTEATSRPTDRATFPPPRNCPFHAAEGHLARREPGPLTKTTLVSGQEAWVASRHADVRAMLTDPAFSANRVDPNFPQLAKRRLPRKETPRTLQFMDGPEHARARRAVVGEFTVRRLAPLKPRIQQIVDDHVDAMLAGPRPADLVAAFALPVPSLVICELLGAPYHDHEYFQARTKTLLSRTGGIEAVRAAIEDLRSYMDGLVTAKEANPGDDLIGRQIRQHRANGTEDHGELVDMALLLLMTGHETTANMISLGTVALLQRPEQAERLRRDPARTPDAVEELLRHLTIVEWISSRVAVADTELAGVPIMAGEGVVTMNLAANHDPAVFAEPDDVDFGRGARNHLAFGYGAHSCLGQNLARLELQVVFDTLLARIPTLRVAVPLEELPIRDDAASYGLDALPVDW
ncbi:cytochrome P450 [Actinophytocola sp.]|uniref:cytochrome P450 n=1 Tax=Actinophytocola sp. TaxID=1872138 RepID=UPI00389B2017